MRKYYKKYIGLIKREEQYAGGVDIKFLMKTYDDIKNIYEWFDLYQNTELVTYSKVVMNNIKELEDMFAIYRDISPVTIAEKVEYKEALEELKKLMEDSNKTL